MRTYKNKSAKNRTFKKVGTVEMETIPSSINQPSFEYTDTILKSWHENHVQTMDDVARLDAEHNKNKFASNMKKASTNNNASTNRFHNFEERDNDYDELEKKLLGN